MGRYRENSNWGAQNLVEFVQTVKRALAGVTGAVRYDAAQGLTEEEQAQGRGNICAATDVEATTTSKGLMSAEDKAKLDGLQPVASTGSYNDLYDKPDIPGAYVLPAATSSSLGGVKVGAGLDMDDGMLSVGSEYVTSSGASAIAADVADSVVSSAGFVTSSGASAIVSGYVDAGGYVTSSGVVSVVDSVILSGGYATSSYVSSAVADKVTSSQALEAVSSAGYATSSNVSSIAGELIASSAYSLPKATTSSLGGVIVGNGLSVASDGTLSIGSDYVTSSGASAIVSSYVSGGGYATSAWVASQGYATTSYVSSATVASAGMATSAGTCTGNAATATDASFLGGVAASSYALDANVVKLSGDQDIAGAKRFTGGLAVKRTSTSTQGDFYFRENDNSTTAMLRLVEETAATPRLQITVKGSSGQYAYSGPQIWLNRNGNVLLRTTNASGDSAKDLILNNDGTLTWNSKGFVYDSGDQTIGGVKSFSESIRTTATTIAMINPNVTKGTAPSATRNTDIIFTENVADPLGSIAGGRVMARLRNVYTTAGDNGITLQIFKPTSGSTTTKQVSFRAMSAGTYNLVPESNDISLGLNASANKWKEIWCAQSSINTSSDERIKQQIADIPDAVLDAWGDVDWIQFKYNDAVEEKGASKARLHNGLIAQRVDGAFKAHGLDASQYGLFLYDKWDAEPEERDDDGTLIREAQPAGDGYGLRYTEALCMEAAYQRRRADRAETRIAVLERRLEALEVATFRE